MHENQEKIPDVSHFEYSKLIIKSACKSSPDTYKSNFTWGKFLFKCPKCKLISKFKPM